MVSSRQPAPSYKPILVSRNNKVGTVFTYVLQLIWSLRQNLDLVQKVYKHRALEGRHTLLLLLLFIQCLKNVDCFCLVMSYQGQL